MHWLKSIIWRFIFHFLAKHYSIRIATTQEEKEKIFKFRYQIYRVEMSHYFLDKIAAHDDMLFDDDDFANNTFILYSGDINNITGTIRFTIWNRPDLPDQIKNKYFINENMKFNSAAESRFNQIRKDYRKSLLGLTLISYIYKILYDKKINLDVCFCDCQPGILKSLLKVGCFPYTSKVIFEDFGILFIPLAIIPFDLAYLKEKQCITYHLAKYYFKLSANKNYVLPSLPHLNLEVPVKELSKYKTTLAHTLFVEFYEIISGILDKMIVITVPSKAVVIRKDIKDFDMFILLEGKLGVFLGNLLITEINPGMLFGEMALVNEQHKRYTDVKCLEDAKLLLIPRSVIAKLEKNNLAAAYKFQHLICVSLQNKLAASNKLLDQSINTTHN